MKRLAACLVALLSGLVALRCGSSYGSAPSGMTTSTTYGSAASVIINIVSNDGSMSFSPDPGTVRAGQTIAWHNADSTTHRIAQDGGGFDVGSIAPGATSNAVSFSATGVVGYHCTIHPGMVGSLTVTQ